MQKEIEELKKRLYEVRHLYSAMSILSWDQEVFMPKKAAGPRSEVLSYLSGLSHEKFTSIDKDGLLSKLKKAVDTGKIKGDNAVIVNEVWTSYSRQKKLPIRLVKEKTETASKAQHVWAEARAKKNFSIYAPTLEKIVKLSREEAKYVGYKESPYDALIDNFEPGMKASDIAPIFSELRDGLVLLLNKIKKSKVKIDQSKARGDFSIQKQHELVNKISEKIGFDMSAGRVDEVSGHPFTTEFHPHDVRFTTRYKKEDIFEGINVAMHEAGHGIYEQGLSHKHFGTPLAESISLGIHESQSRMWENMVGTSLPFWKYFYPIVKKEFPKPFAKLPVSEYYKIINKVQPSFIRVEADEVTYNLHIILRFEIEKDLIEGKIKVKDIPKVWNKKVKEYFGLTVPNDSQGCLQDVHWAHGAIGYFPTYALGNLYGAQMWNKINHDIKGLDKKFEKGDFKPLKDWLQKNIHMHGKRYKANELIKNITGEELNSKYFLDYLEKKYGDIYKV